jgi:hypothetical protein
VALGLGPKSGQERRGQETSTSMSIAVPRLRAGAPDIREGSSRAGELAIFTNLHPDEKG